MALRACIPLALVVVISAGCSNASNEKVLLAVRDSGAATGRTETKSDSKYDMRFRTAHSSGLTFAQVPAHGGSAIVNGKPYDAAFFKDHGTNPFVDADDDHRSTFALDVDTASYTVARSYLKDGRLPPPEAVRVEEFVNYFEYGYGAPHDRAFAIDVDGARSHWGRNRHLLRVGLQARTVKASRREDAVLTFVIDVSGSMQQENRLELVKRSLRYLVDQLGEDDRVGIVTYGTNAEVVLRHVGMEERDDILDAIDDLEPEGSTNAEAGLREGYRLASKAFRPGAVNRVILCTDGVANVGATGPDQILEEVARYVKNGITLTAVGFGMENFNDVLLERLGDRGNGHYAYIDGFDEAKRLFGRDLTSTLQLVAREARIQVDFDPATVRSWRLIGYENRDMADDRFRDKHTDGGEVGAGHSVTALYEVKSWDDEIAHPRWNGRVATIRLRWRDPESDRWEEITEQVEAHDLEGDFDRASSSFQLAVAAAEFAEILHRSPWAKERSLDWVLEIARGVEGDVADRKEVRELVDLVERARRLGGDRKDVAAD